jgi:hypothetical protein
MLLHGTDTPRVFLQLQSTVSLDLFISFFSCLTSTSKLSGGAMSEVGYVAERKHIYEEMKQTGLQFISLRQSIAVIEYAIANKPVQVITTSSPPNPVPFVIFSFFTVSIVDCSTSQLEKSIKYLCWIEHKPILSPHGTRS